jgi:hypothetical protein
MWRGKSAAAREAKSISEAHPADDESRVDSDSRPGACGATHEHTPATRLLGTGTSREIRFTYGHLDAADAARHALQLDEVALQSPRTIRRIVRPIRERAGVSSGLRACALRPGDKTRDYRASDLELRRDGPSYNEPIRFARSRAQGHGARRSFSFILGADAFCRKCADLAEFPACSMPRTSW